jgi:hypothetical protein
MADRRPARWHLYFDNQPNMLDQFMVNKLTSDYGGQAAQPPSHRSFSWLPLREPRTSTVRIS